MADPIWTQDDIDVLKSAIRSGRRRVQFSDRLEEFQDLKDMMALLALMTAGVSEDRQSYRLAAHDKGV